jgi:hypothetical protein
MASERSFLAVLVGLLGCSHDVRDADCTPDEPSVAASDACIYPDGRAPLGPERCEPLLEAPTSDPPFSEIAALITEDLNAMGELRGACTQAICHGTPAIAAGDLYFPEEPAALYAALVSTIGVTVRKPYVVPGDPAATWMHCNMRTPADGGVGLRMPQTHFLTEQDYELLESWILNGAEGP